MYKKIILAALFGLLFSACSKNQVAPDPIDARVYISRIKHANHNEPDTMFYYLVEQKYDQVYYTHNSKEITDFSGYLFKPSKGIPAALYLQGGKYFKTIQIPFNQYKIEK